MRFKKVTIKLKVVQIEITFHLKVTKTRCISDLLLEESYYLKQKLKLVFNWIKTGRKATYKILQTKNKLF